MNVSGISTVDWLLIIIVGGAVLLLIALWLARKDSSSAEGGTHGEPSEHSHEPEAHAEHGQQAPQLHTEALKHDVPGENGHLHGGPTYPHTEAAPAAAEPSAPPTSPAVEAPAVPAVEPPAAAAAPVETFVVPPAAVPAPDDLEIIEGIGPKIKSVLNAAGIFTFRQLIDTDSERLKMILLAANLRLADPTTWKDQAQLAAEGKWDEFKALQDSLKGGRRVS